MNGNPHIGESLERFLRDEGIHGEVTAIAIKRAIVLQIAREMAAKDISEAELARRMKVSPARLARLLDPDNGRVQLGMLVRAASAVGKNLAIRLI